MKKRIASMMLALLFVLSFAACVGESAPSGDAAFTWTRTGYFMDENNAMLIIGASEDAEYPGWLVSFLGEERMVGWYIPQEGETLFSHLRRLRVFRLRPGSGIRFRGVLKVQSPEEAADCSPHPIHAFAGPGLPRC